MESLKFNDQSHPKKVESTPEFMQKLFIMPDSTDRFVEFGAQLLDTIHEFFGESGGIHSSISIEELTKLFSHIEIPKEPMLIVDVLDEIKHNIVKHSVKVADPYYIGHMTSAVPYFMILLEMISVSLNQNQVKIESAKSSSFVEREFTCWIHQLIFQRSPDFYRRHIQNHRIVLGNITSDGTIANLTAMALAVAKAFPPDGEQFHGVRQEGLHRALEHYGYRQAVILVSTRGHYSLGKTGSLLGIGERSVIHIPVHPYTNRMDLDKLQETLDDIRREDERLGKPTKIVALIGIAGTTETGNVDDLISLGIMAKKLGAHYHVDAAWGGGALLMDGGRELLRGIETADSVSMDAHKLLYTPNSMGICVFRNANDCQHLYHTSNYIIREGSIDQGRFTVEGSRSFACLKPWASFKIIGRDGYALIFDHARQLQDNLVLLIEEDPLFELMNQPELFIINYRFVPTELRELLDKYSTEPERHRDKLDALNELIDDLNIELHKTIREHDTSFVSRTRLESTRYAPRPVVVLRAITVNPNTECHMLNDILHQHRQIGISLWDKKRHPAMHLMRKILRKVTG